VNFARTSIVAAVICFAALSRAASAYVTPFTLTHNGQVASFTSAPDPNGFVVSDVIPFQTLQGLTLIELLSDNNELTIEFSQPLSSLSFDFALDVPGPANLDYEVFSGGSLLFSGSATGSVPPGMFFAEGLADVTAPSFDTIVLSSTDASAFAIDNILSVNVAGAPWLLTFDEPEPLSIALFGTGLLGAAFQRRRRAT